jgi:hypothetical protein
MMADRRECVPLERSVLDAGAWPAIGRGKRISIEDADGKDELQSRRAGLWGILKSVVGK